MAAISLHVSECLLESLQRRATEQCTSLEREAVDLLAAGLRHVEAGHDAVEELLQPLELMTDDDLWNAARSRLPRRLSSELEKLHHKKQREGLTIPESDRATQLAEQFDRCLVIRARAIELLNARGHDVSRLKQP